jgi:predicted dehydrogenase
MTAKIIRWGMIGCGDVTEIKNGPGLYKCENSELLGITNRTLAKARDWVKRHGQGRVFDSVDDLLDCKEIDIVYIASTPDTHKEFALRCAGAGKHVYLEKPIALNYDDALEIQKKFKEAERKVFVAHYRRGLRKTEIIKNLIKKISPVYLVDFNRSVPEGGIQGWRQDAAVAGGGIFFETDVHVVDLLDYLFGPLFDRNILTQSFSENNAFEDLVLLSARGRDNILVNGVWQFNGTDSRDLCEVRGKNGTLTFPVLDTGGTAILTTQNDKEQIDFPSEEHVGQGLEQMIVDELLGKFSCPSTLDTAMRALRICCDAQDAIKTLNKTI